MKVLERINRGGFGVVDRIRLDDGQIVARKTFEPSVPVQDEADLGKLRKRFEREVRFQSTFESDAICPVLDWDLKCETPWFTMPFATRTLFDEIADHRNSGTHPSQALADVLNALEELHSLGFVHRDLKPQNILLIDGVWRLTDFGLILPPTGSTTQLTSVGSAWGTPEYAAPEQSSEFHSVGFAADIYAFGCILHDVYGVPPRIPYAQHTAPGLFGAVIERCTDSRPDRRFSSIGALRGALSSIFSAPPEESLSGSAKNWSELVANGEVGDSDKFEQLVRFIKVEADRDERYAVFHPVEEKTIAALHALDVSLWETFILEYSDWIADTSFSFEFCDVLVQRLMFAYDYGNVAIRAAIILSAARMAESHNRWYVMGKVLHICGHDMEEHIAARLCIDIQAFEMEGTFRRCADIIDRPYSSFHPLIRAVIDDGKD